MQTIKEIKLKLRKTLTKKYNNKNTQLIRLNDLLMLFSLIKNININCFQFCQYK